MEFEQPETFQICQLAVALRGAKILTDPKESARQALVLWRAVAQEIQEDKDRFEAERKRQRDEKLGTRELMISQGPDGQSEAMKWLEKNALNSRDRFRSFRNFIEAWIKFQPGDADYFFENGKLKERPPVVRVSEYELRKFLSFREAERLERDRERKAASRFVAKPETVPSELEAAREGAPVSGSPSI